MGRDVERQEVDVGGGVWMIGSHCFKTWNTTQGPIALSSAEAELYAMIEAVTRAKGLGSLAKRNGIERAWQKEKWGRSGRDKQRNRGFADLTKRKMRT